MTTSQGCNPFNSLIAQGRTSRIPPTISRKPDFCDFEQKIAIDVDSLAKSVLYACHKCNGALVPEEKCLVCNRISIRKCVNCGNEILMGTHQCCEYLVLFSNVIKKKHQSLEKESKN